MSHRALLNSVKRSFHKSDLWLRINSVSTLALFTLDGNFSVEPPTYKVNFSPKVQTFAFWSYLLVKTVKISKIIMRSYLRSPINLTIDEFLEMWEISAWQVYWYNFGSYLMSHSWLSAVKILFKVQMHKVVCWKLSDEQEYFLSSP